MNKKIIFLTLLIAVLLPIAFVTADDGPTIQTAVERVAVIANTVGLAMIVIGWMITGILYLTSAGSPEKTGTAKKALIACVIGTVVVILANTGGMVSVIKDALNFQ